MQKLLVYLALPCSTMEAEGYHAAAAAAAQKEQLLPLASSSLILRHWSAQIYSDKAKEKEEEKKKFEEEKLPSLISTASYGRQARLCCSNGSRIRRGKKPHNEKILAILESLRCAEDVESAMLPWRGKLTPREEAILLNEQHVDLNTSMALFGWFKSQKNYVPNVFRYNIMFKIIGKHRKWELLRQLWDEMLNENHVCPNNVTYSTIIDAYSKAGLQNEALKWFEGMDEDITRPDEVTLNTVLNLYKSAGQYTEAEKFSRKFVYSLQGDEKHIRPYNLDTYNTLMDLYGKAGCFVEAADVFEDMVSCGLSPDTVSYNIMMQISGRSRGISEVEALFEKMVDSGCEPDLGTYNILIALYVKAGDLLSARKTFMSSKRSRASTNAVSYRTLFHGYCCNGLVNEAENIAIEMEQAGFPLNEALRVQFIQTCIKAGDYAKASEQFHRLKLCMGLSIDTLVPLIDLYAERGSWKQAEEIFLSLAELGLQRNTLLYNVMIKAYGVGKMYQKALNLFTSMNSEGITADEATFNTIIHAASVCGDVGMAVSLLSQMHEAGFKPSLSSYTAILSLYGKSRQIKEAETIFQEMKIIYSHIDEVAYTAMVNAYVNAGMQTEAEATLHAMEVEGHATSSIAYCLMMKLYGKLDMLEKAEEVFRRIECMEMQPNVHAWNILLDIYGRIGMTNNAWVSFRKMQKGRYVDKASCKTIIKILRKAGRTQEAFAVANVMQKLGLLFGVSSFNAVIDLYARNGKYHEALYLFEQMIKNRCWPNLRTYFCLKDVLENPGLLKEAVWKLKLARKQENNVICRLIAMTTFYCFAGMQTEAMQECKKLKESRIALDIAAYNTILHVYGANGKFDEATNVFMQLRTNGPTPNVVTFTTMLLLYGKAGLVEGVIRLFSTMKQSGYRPDESCFKTVINIYRRAGRFDLASVAKHEMHSVLFLKEGRNS